MDPDIGQELLLGCLEGKKGQMTKNREVFNWAPVDHPAIGQGTRKWKAFHSLEENMNQATDIAYCPHEEDSEKCSHPLP